ncbi:sulfotransferase family protein [Mycobacterium montefiorense]|uniref:Sulfotransferase n=1 Tax=Mycobacterium montefiorense TaxID=154654 RepID=A0AA37PS22_9MYCO|nr:sulfotransferase [Mycobacterium montefiorense]GBG36793.1 sulfotransferase [Mycobacterium montefiorense]GKU37553.1 sulfotransferase [Mycobacterium montefiorense]GKU42579.1 sulfotransferase [Mycobacterium montefiorense]GKU48743.1 sulfotransferase [Mycobacterium montefiorense]GKU50768.1 sulfotransferase [Mycobacterium montefiorense]
MSDQKDYDNIATTDDVFKLASQRTGLSEIDSDSWRDGLQLILDDLNNSPAFTQFGRERILDDSTNALGRRMQVHGYIQQHPEVLDAPVERPLIVLGMPRTGTTVISYLLDRDPGRRSLLHWQCVDPIPPAPTESLRTDPRCLALLEEQAKILEMVTQAKVALPHWEDADGPTEDMFIHNQDFKGLSWDSFLSTSRYSEWLFDETDMTSTYEYQKRYLQVLQSTAPGAWSLKMPSHSVHIEALLKVFPDARLVWAHRDPYKATGSLANLWKLPKGMTHNPEAIDSEAMGRNAMWQMRYHVDRPLRARERIGDDRFFHMYYHEMMRDPMDVMRRIYAWAGDPLTTEAEASMRNWLAEHPQDRFALNSYSLDQYGLSVEQLEPVFAEYLDTFDIELEAAP